MKEAYPIILSEEKGGYFVRIPDFDIETQGKNFVKKRTILSGGSFLVAKMITCWKKCLAPCYISNC